MKIKIIIKLYMLFSILISCVPARKYQNLNQQIASKQKSINVLHDQIEKMTADTKKLNDSLLISQHLLDSLRK